MTQTDPISDVSTKLERKLTVLDDPIMLVFLRSPINLEERVSMMSSLVGVAKKQKKRKTIDCFVNFINVLYKVAYFSDF